MVENTEVQIGCILWENTFALIHKNEIPNSQPQYIFTVHSRQTKGWMGFNIFTKKENFEDSIGVVGYFPNNILELKNHTSIVEKNRIFGQIVQNMLFNSIDGTFTFAFKLNASEVEGKNYFAFSQNIYQSPDTNNGSLTIPKHYSYSSIQFLQLNSTNNYIPVCRMGLNIPGRIATYHTAGYITTVVIYIFVFFLLINFKNDQPLKSRFTGPYICLAAVFFNLVFEQIFAMTTFEKSSPNYCIISIITLTPFEMAAAVPLVIYTRYYFMLRLFNSKRSFLKRIRNNSDEDIKTSRLKIWFNFFLKSLSSPWISLVYLIIFTIIFVISMVFAFAMNEFKCTSSTYDQMRYIYLAFYGFSLGVFFLVTIIDFIFNIPLIFRCKWKKIFVDDDPYNFRLELLPCIIALPLIGVWSFASLPKIGYSTLTEILDYILLFITGWQTLFVTIIKKTIFLIKKSKHQNDEKMSIKHCTSPEIIDVFIEFCESEWSVENISCKMDIGKYRSLTSISTRKRLSRIIRTKYLIVGVSELEVNAPNHFFVSINKKIEEEIFEDDLFDGLESVIDSNLCDTISRFQFSSLYFSHLKDMEKKNKTLGL
eukprot:gene12037-5434_t